MHLGAGGPFRWAFRWLPLFHLVLGLLGGFALQRWSTAWQPMRPMREWMRWPSWLATIPVWFRSLGAWSCLLVAAMTVYAWDRSSYGWDVSSLDESVVFTGLALLALSAAWLFADWRLSADSPVRVWIPVAITALALIVGNYRSVHFVPVWQWSDGIREPAPFDKARTYLAVMTMQDVYGAEGRGKEIGRCGCGNTAMYSGMSFVNGYSALDMVPYVKLLGLQWSGFTTLPEGKTLLKDHLAAGHLLSQMGVDGLVLGPDFARYAELVKQAGWNLVKRLPLGTVFHRSGPPLPRVRSLTDVVLVNSDNQERVSEPSLSVATIRDVAETRLSVRCQVENPDPRRCALIAFSRAYYPGYRAYLNGAEVPVETLNVLQPAVRMAPGSKGELLLVFAPKSVGLGIIMAATSLLAAGAFLTTSTLFGPARRADRHRLLLAEQSGPISGRPITTPLSLWERGRG